MSNAIAYGVGTCPHCGSPIGPLPLDCELSRYDSGAILFHVEQPAFCGCGQNLESFSVDAMPGISLFAQAAQPRKVTP